MNIKMPYDCLIKLRKQFAKLLNANYDARLDTDNPVDDKRSNKELIEEYLSSN